MLKTIKLKNVGPIPDKSISFRKRLNIITGDNGLGKTFLLDIVWYVLTRKWPAEVNAKLTSGYMARPADPKKTAEITFDIDGEKENNNYTATFDRIQQGWTGISGRPFSPGLVIYAHADGSFSVWDPARNYWDKRGDADIQERHPAFVFSPAEVWNGLKTDDGKYLCNGLLQDWSKWQNNHGWEFQTLEKILERLSPPDLKLCSGALTRIAVDDSRDIPTITMPYGEVPVLFASAGIRRILALTYFLTWAMSEHRMACDVLGIQPTSQITFLIDEVEAHLHPKWQRQIMRGFLDVLETLLSTVAGKKERRIQIIAATHSPLIMSSLESRFNPDEDCWFDFDEDKKGKVCFSRRDYEKQGNADMWLRSNAFDLTSSCSLEAEEAMNDAVNLIGEYDSKMSLDRSVSEENAKKVYKKLLKNLSPKDDFLFRFRYLCEKKGIVYK